MFEATGDGSEDLKFGFDSSAERLLAEREGELDASEERFLALTRRDNGRPEAKLSSEALAVARQTDTQLGSLEAMSEVKRRLLGASTEPA